MEENEKQQYYDSPPRIINNYRPRGYKSMLKEAAQNVRLGKLATKLLEYYCDQKTGFSPALKEIEKHTGMQTNKIWEIREQLVQRRLIDYSPSKHILIHWEYIRAFALMAYPKPKKSVKRDANGRRKLKPIKQKDELATIAIGRALTKAESMNADFFFKRYALSPRCTIGQIISRESKGYRVYYDSGGEDTNDVEIDLRTLKYPNETRSVNTLESVAYTHQSCLTKEVENHLMDMTEMEYEAMVSVFPEYQHRDNQEAAA